MTPVQADEEPPRGFVFDCPWCPLILHVWHQGMLQALVQQHIGEHASVTVRQFEAWLRQKEQ